MAKRRESTGLGRTSILVCPLRRRQFPLPLGDRLVEDRDFREAEIQSDPQEDPKWKVPASWVKLHLTMPFRKELIRVYHEIDVTC